MVIGIEPIKADLENTSKHMVRVDPIDGTFRPYKVHGYNLKLSTFEEIDTYFNFKTPEATIRAFMRSRDGFAPTQEFDN